MSQPDRSTAIPNTKKREQATENQHQQPSVAASTHKKLSVGFKDTKNGTPVRSASDNKRDIGQANSKPSNNEKPNEAQRGAASAANKRTARALALIEEVEQERFNRPRSRGAQALAPLDRLRARVLAANADDVSSRELEESYGRGRVTQGSRLLRHL